MTVESLLSGFVGALVGALLTVVIYLIDRRHRQVTALRAIHMEFVNVVTRIQALIDHGAILGPLATPLWDSLLPLAAGALSEDELRAVGSAVFFVSHCQRLQERLDSGQALTEDNLQTLRRSREELSKAVQILRKRAF